MEKFVIFYVSVLDEDKGIFVDGPYLGGVCLSKDMADFLARDLTNDKQLPGTVMPKVYAFDSYLGVGPSHYLAKNQFQRMAEDMYDMERVQARQSRMRRRK